MKTEFLNQAVITESIKMVGQWYPHRLCGLSGRALGLKLHEERACYCEVILGMVLFKDDIKAPNLRPFREGEGQATFPLADLEPEALFTHKDLCHHTLLLELFS